MRRALKLVSQGARPTTRLQIRLASCAYSVPVPQLVNYRYTVVQLRPKRSLLRGVYSDTTELNSTRRRHSVNNS